MIRDEIKRLEEEIMKSPLFWEEARLKKEAFEKRLLLEGVYLEWLWDAVEFVTRKEDVR